MAIISGIARATIKWLALTIFAIAGILALWFTTFYGLSIVGHIQ